MVKSQRIRVRSRVAGHFGPFTSDATTPGKRRRRGWVAGTVVKAAEQHKWDILFDFNGEVKQGVSSRSLTIVPEGVGIDIFNTNDDSQKVSSK